MKELELRNANCLSNSSGENYNSDFKISEPIYSFLASILMMLPASLNFLNHRRTIKIARKYWCVLIQRTFRRKAVEVYCGMSDENAINYSLLKAAIVKAYQLPTETYRQMLRNRRKGETETLSEFTANRW